VVARELYGVDCPVLLLDPAAYARAAACASVAIESDGTVTGA
jgi:hypothetical protein